VYEPGDEVDLFDTGLKQWRGAYIVMLKKADTPLIKIRNLRTGSLQFVSAERLRRASLPPFAIQSLRS
jgi:hypothetical protein